MTSLQFLVLHTASQRSDYAILPMTDVPRLARASFLSQLTKLGFITRGDNPKLTGAGLKCVRGR